MPGYTREEFEVTRVPTGKVVNSIWVGGLIGLAVDASTGADNKLVPEQIDVTLRPIRAAVAGDALSAVAPREER